MKPLWNYQAPLVDAVLADVAARAPKVVLAAAPGSGKTLMACHILHEALRRGLARRVLVLAHGTNVLRQQFADDAARELGPDSVHHYVPKNAVGHVPIEKVKAKIVVAIPQAFRTAETLPKFDLVIVDEAHEFFAEPMAQRVIKLCRPRSCVLLTGSPAHFVLEGLPVHMISLNEVHKQKPSAICRNLSVELVASDYLIDIGEYQGTKEVRKDFKFDEGDTKATLDRLLEKLVKHLPKRRSGTSWKQAFESLGKTMIVCRSQDLARQVFSYFEARKVEAALSTHEDDSANAEIERFKVDDALSLLIVVRRANLGFNFPRLINLVDMTETINIDRLFQMLCRLVRPHPDDPTTPKLFVKISPRGRMQTYTRDVLRASMLLGERSYFETWNGQNLDGFVIPTEREVSDEERAAGEEGEGGRRLPMLDERFQLFDDFFEAIVPSMDRAFSPYARTTLGKAREKALGIVRESDEERLEKYAALVKSKRRPLSLRSEDPEERRLAKWGALYLRRAEDRRAA